MTADICSLIRRYRCSLPLSWRCFRWARRYDWPLPKPWLRHPTLLLASPRFDLVYANKSLSVIRRLPVCWCGLKWCVGMLHEGQLFTWPIDSAGVAVTWRMRDALAAGCTIMSSTAGWMTVGSDSVARMDTPVSIESVWQYQCGTGGCLYGDIKPREASSSIKIIICFNSIL